MSLMKFGVQILYCGYNNISGFISWKSVDKLKLTQFLKPGWTLFYLKLMLIYMDHIEQSR